jgi:hypothetical protein
MVRNFLKSGIDALALSDTTGMGDPASVGNLLELLVRICGKPAGASGT